MRRLLLVFLCLRSDGKGYMLELSPVFHAIGPEISGDAQVMRGGCHRRPRVHVV